MATLISNSTGNFTSSGSWSLVDSTSHLNSEAASTASTTSFVSSSGFVPGAITIDGIAVKVLSRSATPTGTFSVRLFDNTLASVVAGTTVTIDVADIPSVNGSTNAGWLFMKFSAPVLLLITNSYSVQISSSTASQVTLYRDSTAGNWSRILRTTTTQAPASGDTLFVVGEYISSGSNNSFTITMDDTSATTYGKVEVCTKGTLAYGIAASTAYHIKLGNDLVIYSDGTYTQGTAASPMPSSSAGFLEFVNSSNVDFGITVRAGGTFKTGGAVITNKAFLAADAAVSATSLTTDVSTGWLSGDTIAIASTTQTRAECENKALTANASGTTLTITALTNAHSGTSPTRAELANLTRNVRIFGTSASLQTYINILTTSIVDLQSTEFYFMGSATTGKRGIDVGTTTGSCTINNCSVHDFSVTSSIGINCNSASNDNITISNTTIYNTASTGLNVSATSGTANTHNNILSIFTGGVGANFGDLGGTISNITAAGATGSGITLAEIGTSNFGTISNLTSHSNTTTGLSLVNYTGFGNNPLSSISNVTVWRNLTNGLSINNVFGVKVSTITAFGNSTSNVQLAGSTGQVYLDSITSNAGTTFLCPLGVGIAANVKDIFISNSTFGATTTHSTGDVSVTASNIYPRVNFRNCSFNSTTTLAGQSNIVEGGYVSMARFQQTSGNHRTYNKFGISTSDSTIFNTASPSLRLSPNSASRKYQVVIGRFPVTSGSTLTVEAYVRKSVIGDGTAYNGNQPRLIVKENPAAGINSDTVLDTGTNGSGSWELLSGTTAAVSDDTYLEIEIDCDGTAGWVNVDDMLATVPNVTGLKYWFDGLPFTAGTTDDSGLYTDPGVANVRLGTTYKFNSSTLNRTGTVRVPSTAEVKTGVLFDASDSLTGTYDGSDRWTDPGESNVRLSTAYKANSLVNNKTGNVRSPAIADVKFGVAYDSNDSLVGTFGDGTPPTFAGISSLVANIDGSLTASWSAATDPSLPLRYSVYIQAATATGLFSTTPFVTQSLSHTMYTLPGGGALTNGVVYYVGVRATDGSNNQETNTVSLFATSSGVNDGAINYDVHGVFSISGSNMLQGTLWASKDGVNANIPALGVANYTVYDSTGATVGISESGITADANGQFIITPVSAASLVDLNHYVVKIGIVVDSAERISYTGITLGE